MGKACNAVDLNPQTGWYRLSDESWHFNTNHLFAESGGKYDSRTIHAEEQMGKAMELESDSIASKDPKEKEQLHIQALEELGKGLHAVEDTRAHADEYVSYAIIPGLEIPNHFFTAADDPDENPARLMQTEADAKAYLMRFITYREIYMNLPTSKPEDEKSGEDEKK
jgi:hypothetical protein